MAFDKLTVKSISGLRKQEETLPSTYTGEAFLSLFDATRNLEREQIQQEVRLITELDGPLNFVAGGIYISDELDFRSYATVGLSSLFPGAPFLDERGYVNLDLRGITGNPGHGIVKQDRKSWALYTDGTLRAERAVQHHRGGALHQGQEGLLQAHRRWRPLQPVQPSFGMRSRQTPASVGPCDQLHRRAFHHGQPRRARRLADRSAQPSAAGFRLSVHRR